MGNLAIEEDGNCVSVSVSLPPSYAAIIKEQPNKSAFVRDLIDQFISREDDPEILIQERGELQSRLRIIDEKVAEKARIERSLQAARDRDEEEERLRAQRYKLYASERRALEELMVEEVVRNHKTDLNSTEHYQWIEGHYGEAILNLKKRFRKEARDYPDEKKYIINVVRSRAAGIAKELKAVEGPGDQLVIR